MPNYNYKTLDRLLGSVKQNDNKMTKLIKSNLNEKIVIILQEQ